MFLGVRIRIQIDLRTITVQLYVLTVMYKYTIRTGRSQYVIDANESARFSTYYVLDSRYSLLSFVFKI
jgi:hypothetical protein